MAITDEEIQRVRAASVRDDCFNILVPSDVRLLLNELDRLRKENAELRAEIARLTKITTVCGLTELEAKLGKARGALAWYDRELCDCGWAVHQRHYEHCPSAKAEAVLKELSE